MAQSAIEILAKWESNQSLTFHSATSGTHINIPMAANDDTLCPDHLFIGSISSGFMKRVLTLAAHEKFQIADFVCSATATYDFTAPHPLFDKITLVPAITIADAAFIKKAMMLLQKGRQSCIVLNSLSAMIVFAPHIKISEQLNK